MIRNVTLLLIGLLVLSGCGRDLVYIKAYDKAVGNVTTNVLTGSLDIQINGPFDYLRCSESVKERCAVMYVPEMNCNGVTNEKLEKLPTGKSAAVESGFGIRASGN